MPRHYVEVEIRADPSLAEHLVGLLTQLGVEAFWEDGPSLKCYVRRERWTEALQKEVEAVVARSVSTSRSPAPRLAVRLIEEENWNAQWKQTIRPIHLTNRTIVAPTWQPYETRPGEILVTIDPKMSFGTGYHESTRLAVRLIERHLVPGTTMLDVGTGTGILAIAAVKLGASSAVGVDIDEWSYENARENVALNGLTGIVAVIQGELMSLHRRAHGLIAANIHRAALEELLPEMAARLAEGGVLVLAGLLETDRGMISTLLASRGFRILEEIQEHEWIGIAATQPLKSRCSL